MVVPYITVARLLVPPSGKKKLEPETTSSEGAIKHQRETPTDKTCCTTMHPPHRVKNIIGWI